MISNLSNNLYKETCLNLPVQNSMGLSKLEEEAFTK